MSRRKWSDLDPRLQRALLIAGAFEAGLKVAALIDLTRRPASTVRGSKRAWAAALTFGNSAGVLPIVYLVRGRKN